MLTQYPDPDSVETQKSMNQLCVRIVFCLYAEDAGIFGAKNAFHDYLVQFKASETRDALNRLFEVLNTKEEDRKRGDVYYAIQEHERLGSFPYVNGGMFAGKVDIPNFTDELRTLVLRDASDNFDWSQISPAIFGAVFESTLNADERRKNGMHYTSIENIHKVIDPLFLNDLKQELKAIEETTSYIRKKHLAEKFQIKLSKLKFLDPACGSGNFLTETYLSLRNLENEAIKIQHPNPMLDVGQASDYIKVSIQQFYGIELNDFAVSVAKTAMWIAECQMFEKTKDIIYAQGDFLPLKTYVHIHEGDALKIDWNDVVDKQELSYIIGNPPFVGYKYQSELQRIDIRNVYVDDNGKQLKNAGKIDFVAGWFYKASKFIQNTSIKVALVSTNSISQGDQVAPIWEPLFNMFNIHIDFAYRTFPWNSEAESKASVYVVIIGFSSCLNKKAKLIFDGNKTIISKNINPYLSDAPNIFVHSQTKPLCNVPRMSAGNRSADGNALIIEGKDYESFINREPKAKRWIKQVAGSKEFLHNEKRYCLWLVGITPHELNQMPLVKNRIALCRKNRLNGAKDRQKLADTPTVFREQMNPTNYLLVPIVSSERRKYVPMGYLHDDIIPIASANIVPNASIYDFGILESSVNMAWMRAVAGRLEMRYRYSAKIVYNNFPWPIPTSEQKHKIEETAQKILDVRKKYPDSSLADLYDPLTMPADLRKAHEKNDKAVLDAYGLSNKSTESEIVAHLFKMYEELTKKDNVK